MKILRIRRGFTTNSSGANEYLPDGGTAPGPSGSYRTSPSASPSASAFARARDGGAPSTSASAEAETSSPFPEPTSNSTAAGVVFVVVVGAFVAGPVLRMLWRKRRKNDQPPGDDVR